MSTLHSTGHFHRCEGGTVSIPTKYHLLIKDLSTVAWKSTYTVVCALAENNQQGNSLDARFGIGLQNIDKPFLTKLSDLISA